MPCEVNKKRSKILLQSNLRSAKKKMIILILIAFAYSLNCIEKCELFQKCIDPGKCICIDEKCSQQKYIGYHTPKDSVCLPNEDCGMPIFERVLNYVILGTIGVSFLVFVCLFVILPVVVVCLSKIFVKNKVNPEEV